MGGFYCDFFSPTFQLLTYINHSSPKSSDRIARQLTVLP